MNPDSDPIGGFFEIEIPPIVNPVHPEAIALSTGRSCLCAVLQYANPKRCFVPHFTCDATLDPFKTFNVEIQFYELDSSLRPVGLTANEDSDFLLLTNYWGLQRNLMAEYSESWGSRLIVDDTHDFHSYHRYPKSWSFTSARKYFGVPDGAFLYVPDEVEKQNVVSPSTERFSEISLQHSVHRNQGHQAQAFGEYQAYEKSLPCELLRISKYAESILSHLDLESAFHRRRQNFNFLAEALNDSNSLRMNFESASFPFVYPYLPTTPIPRKGYHDQQIFVPTLWPDVLTRGNVTCQTAVQLTENLIPIPIDHRYSSMDMQRIVEVTRTLECQP